MVYFVPGNLSFLHCHCRSAKFNQQEKLVMNLEFGTWNLEFGTK
jgi:hypothetical protein